MEFSEIIHDEDAKRFVLEVDDKIASIDYEMKSGKMYLVHSEVPHEFRGKGVGRELVEQTFQKLTDSGHKAVAICSYIRHVAERSDKWKEIIEI